MTIRAEVVETAVPVVLPTRLNHYAVLYWTSVCKAWTCHTLTPFRETADRVRNDLMKRDYPTKIVHITETPSTLCLEHHKDLAEKEGVEPPDEVVAGMQGVEPVEARE